MSTAQLTYEGYKLTSHKSYPAMKIITPEGGRGSVPEELRGGYTSFQAAKDHIDALQLKKKRAKDDAKAKQTSRDEHLREGDDNGSKSS